MIHIFVGTKAQFIKMMPIMQVLADRGIAYNFIDAGQHGGLTGSLVKQFNLKMPDVYLRKNSDTIRTIGSAIQWTLTSVGRLLLSPEKVYKRIFKGQGGICLIHGDTLTTLISLLYAKRCGLKVAHVEAGLRSFNYFDPFPEEIIRLLAMRYSDLLFAPADKAWNNLCQMGYAHKAIHIRANTGQDAVAFALQKKEYQQPHSDTIEKYVVATIHRLETLFSKKRMSFIVAQILKLSRSINVIFVLHAPTIQQLRKYGLVDRIKDERIELRSLQAYVSFIHLLANSEFVITDGGSIQEECFFLNKPCLIMRSKTERDEGIGENALLSNFDAQRINAFITHYQDYQRHVDPTTLHPSASIVENLHNYV
jgi:UDP-N-acetylglucosamine 2-epimerase (non-hydrolysing)